MPRSLWDLLACPVCRCPVQRDGDARLVCATCARTFPVVDGVPWMHADPAMASLRHEGELPARPGYSMWKDRLVLKSLTDANVVLDFGAGNQALDDPCIIRFDLVPGPFVDVVGDLHALPFQNACIDYAFGNAVFEHLQDPWRAATELHRVLRPGGYVYADWNFIVAYHGYPHHYFNASVHGMARVFAPFTTIDLGVAPFAGAAFALRSLLGTYLQHFQPESPIDREFAALLHRVLWYPLDEFDRRIPRDDWFRLASGVYFLGVKPGAEGETILPAPVLDAWRRRPDLQARFPNPLDLGRTDNLMLWAKGEGARTEPDVAACLGAIAPFSKRGTLEGYDRSAVEGWETGLVERAAPLPSEAVRQEALWFSRPVAARLRESWSVSGVAGVAKMAQRAARRLARRVARRLGGAASVMAALAFLLQPVTALAAWPPAPQQTQVADGVYVFSTAPYGDVGLDGNSVAVVGDDGVLVFDTNGTPAAAAAVLAQIRKITSLPVRFVVNSHWHWDHWYGTEVYSDAFPGVQVIAHEKTRELMAGPALEFNRPGIDEQLPAYVASLEARLKALEQSKPDAPETSALRARLAEDKAFLDQKRRVRHVLPAVTFDGRLSLRLGRREVQVINAGRGVTPGDAFLYLPAERVLVTGDLLVNPISFALSCYPSEWIAALERLDAFDAQTIVTGHGAPLHDESLLHSTLSLLRELLQLGREARRQGQDVDAARAVILPKVAARKIEITGGDAALGQAFDVQLVDWFLHRVYEEADGPLTDRIAAIPRG